MIIHRGKGCWVGLLPFALMMAFGFAWQGFRNVFGVNGDPPYWYSGLALIAAGVLLYLWGRRLNEPLERAEATAEAEAWEEGVEVDKRFRGRHSLYEISMEWWGVACAGFGVLMFLIGLKK